MTRNASQVKNEWFSNRQINFSTTAKLIIGSSFYYKLERRPAGNSGFKKLAVQWLQEVQFSNETFVVADSLVLRNRQLLKPAKRYQPFDDKI